MAKSRESMQKLTELRDRLRGDLERHLQTVEALRNQLIGVETSIKVVGPDAASGPRRNVKRTVMELVQEAGKAGITASEVVERAKSRGRDLDRASVSSLLSRFKREGALTFDGQRYFSTQPQAAPQEPPLKIVKTVNGG